MRLILRILLVLSLGFVGMVCTIFLAGRYLVPAGSGLAAAPIALAYGLFGGLACAIAGGVLGFKLTGKSLMRITLSVTVTGLLLLGILVLRFARAREAEMDPESAYRGLAGFRVRLQQLVIVDPYLSTQTQLDTGPRRWTIRLPDGRSCRGNLGAEAQRRVADALAELTSLKREDLAPCTASADEAERLLEWEWTDARRRGPA